MLVSSRGVFELIVCLLIFSLVTNDPDRIQNPRIWLDASNSWYVFLIIITNVTILEHSNHDCRVSNAS